MGETAGTQAIERAADLLVRVVESGDPVGIGELAATSGLPKSTTSRLVGALERQGLVERDGQRGRLRPGPVLLRYAHRADATLVDLADDALRRLAQRSAETVNLGVPAYEAVEHLAQRDSRHFVGVGNWIGRRVPLHATANGKIFLAYGAARIPAHLDRLASETVTDRARLEREFADVRARGYATAVDELEDGLAAVAAPVFGSDGAVVAALSVSAPSVRLTSEQMDAVIPYLQEESDALSARLGYTKGGAA
ncbi:MAG: IclR family transcriptional regulator [Thermoleophilia bacterium]|nr:IclR family transcriptional regulator [Thermoleophilia bacterium]